MRMRLAILAAAFSALSLEAASAAAQNVNNDTLAVMKSVGRYLRTTYGPRLTISSKPLCHESCPDSEVAGRERAAIVESGGFSRTNLSKLPVVCSPKPRSGECRFTDTDGFLHFGEPIIHDDRATIAMAIGLNGPHGQPAYYEDGILSLEKRGGHWAVTRWQVVRVLD